VKTYPPCLRGQGGAFTNYFNYLIYSTLNLVIKEKLVKLECFASKNKNR